VRTWPGAELVLRVKDLAPSPDTLVVVNCAGRTRSIIGAQSLINAGVPNKVVALRNGTMGWNLAGFTCGHGETKQAPAPSHESVGWAKHAAGSVAQRLGIEETISRSPEGFALRVGPDAKAGLPKSLADAVTIVGGLVGDPHVLLFDEANGALDRETDAAPGEGSGSQGPRDAAEEQK